MKGKLLLAVLFVIAFSSLASAQQIAVEVHLLITPETMKVTAADLYEGEPALYVLDYDEYYTGKVFSVNNEELYRFNFSKSFYVFDAGVELDEVTRVVTIPYYSTLGRLEVWDGREKMLDYDLTAFNSCNEDTICDLFENERSCPQDCTTKIIVPEEKKKPSIIAPQAQQSSSPRNPLLPFFIGVLLFILIVIGILILRARRKV